jgi:hypothetical protein
LEGEMSNGLWPKLCQIGQEATREPTASPCTVIRYFPVTSKALTQLDFVRSGCSEAGAWGQQAGSWERSRED